MARSAPGLDDFPQVPGRSGAVENDIAVLVPEGQVFVSHTHMNQSLRPKQGKVIQTAGDDSVEPLTVARSRDCSKPVARK